MARKERRKQGWGLRIVGCIEGLKPRLNGHPVVKLLLPVCAGSLNFIISLFDPLFHKFNENNLCEELFNEYLNIINNIIKL